MSTLIPDNPVPLYEQLHKVLSEEILTGVYKENDRLPNEMALCALYNVSRITVRKAIDILCEEGMLVKNQGKGTYVSYKPVKTPISSHSGFTNPDNPAMKNRTTHVVTKETIKCDQALADRFQLPQGACVYKMLRILKDKGIPLMLDISYFPCAMYPDILDVFADNVSVYRTLQGPCGVVMQVVDKEISASICREEYARYLECEVGSPLIDIWKISYNPQSLPVYVSNLQVLAGRASYMVRVQSDDSSSTLLKF